MHVYTRTPQTAKQKPQSNNHTTFVFISDHLAVLSEGVAIIHLASVNNETFDCGHILRNMYRGSLSLMQALATRVHVQYVFLIWFFCDSKMITYTHVHALFPFNPNIFMYMHYCMRRTENVLFVSVFPSCDYVVSFVNACHHAHSLPLPLPPALPQPGSESSLKRNKSVLSLMSKIPEEAESLTVLVGGVQFLQQPIVAFVRLDQVR